MRTYTVTEYDKEDYNAQSKEILEMTNDELAQEIRNIARGWLPDYNYTGAENDFENHKRQIIMSRVATILEEI